MQKKKVCIISTVHPLFDVRIFHKEAKTLAREGYDVCLIAPHNKDEIIDGIKIIALPKPKKRLERFIKTDFLAYKRALSQRADIYHFHDPELLPWAVKLKKKTKSKIIYDVHESLFDGIISRQSPPIFLRYLLAFFLKKLEIFFAKKIDFIITVTPYIKKKFEGINNNVELIANYPLLSEFFEGCFYDSLKKERAVCYIGEIEKNRNIENIIEAIKISRAKIFLAGNFSSLSFEKKLKKKKGWEKVEYLGFVKREKLKEIFKKSIAGLVLFLAVPNYRDALPNKIFEYMAGGLAVIASNFPQWKEIVEGNNCGICVNPSEPKEIAGAIKYLIEHPEIAKKMGENGRKAIFEKYNWESESKKLLEIYQKLCAE